MFFLSLFAPTPETVTAGFFVFDIDNISHFDQAGIAKRKKIKKVVAITQPLRYSGFVEREKPSGKRKGNASCVDQHRECPQRTKSSRPEGPIRTPKSSGSSDLPRALKENPPYSVGK
jgi:hypothetical protein